MNELIVKRIRDARKERGMTEQDLADYIGRTASAISDLERGKVQVSASDLYQLAQLLNKPIEYFYGEEFGDKEIQDLIAVLRKQSPEARKQSISTTALLLQMQRVGDLFTNNPDQQPSASEIKEFFDAFIPFSKMINEMTTQLNDLQDKITHELELQGIDVAQ